MKVVTGVAGCIAVLGTLAAAADCSSNPTGTCVPGSAGCTAPDECAGGPTCRGDGSSQGARCACGGLTDGGSFSDRDSSDGSAPSTCSPCWQGSSCCVGVTCLTIVSLSGTKNQDGSCTLTQATPDGGMLTALALECTGKTSQGSAWTYAAVPSAPQLGVVLQFTVDGSVYGLYGSVDWSVVTDEMLYCEAPSLEE